MPPRNKATKSTKAFKENIGIVDKSKPKTVNKVGKPPRKVLGDKTNSASDDNASIDLPKKLSQKDSSDINKVNVQPNNENVLRPRRDRRLPNRFIENQVLKTLSNSKENEPLTSANKDATVQQNNVPKSVATKINSSTSGNKDCTAQSPIKTPPKVLEVSLVANRPKRISRLPSKFEDHSISPSKFIPVQPCHASTPLPQKNAKKLTKTKLSNDVNTSNTNEKNTSKVKLNKGLKKKATDKKPKDADSNNNARARTLRSRRVANNEVQQKQNQSKSSPFKTVSPETATKPIKKIISKVKKSPVKASITVQPHFKNSNKDTSLKKKSSPAKKLISKHKESPIIPTSPVKHSYINAVNKDDSLKSNNAKSPVKVPSPIKKSTLRIRKDLSFKVLEDNKKNNCNNQDIYEFTYDPNEEPAPQKKKRKAVKRKPAKPKPKYVTFKSTYDQNVNKALTALKKAVTKKPEAIDAAISHNNKNVSDVHENVETNAQNKNVPQMQRNIASKIIIGSTLPKHANTDRSIPQIQDNVTIDKYITDFTEQQNQQDIISSANQVSTNSRKLLEPQNSIRVEDIAADFESSPPHTMDYSPVNSPSRPKTPIAQISRSSGHYNDDPLNLKGNMSFDPNPIASSSMNTSVRHPHASPWRIEFESLPIRWHVNSYVKPNMTPAVECSFVNFDDKNKKKHVYTNLLPETNNDELPEIVQKEQPNLVQTSIISFIKEVVEKSSSKKNRGRSVTPVTSSLFGDTTDKTPNKDNEKVSKTTRQLFTPKKNLDRSVSDVDTNASNDSSKDSSKGLKRKHDEEPYQPSKTPRKENVDKFFGFDDSENVDQENDCPHINIGRKRSLRPKARAVLKELNAQPGPTRAIIPLAAKTARQVEVDRLYDEMRSATDAPIFPASETVGASKDIEPIEELDEDSQTSVHLFEDIDFVHHHLKPQRKSYGKAKKVTFIRQASTDSDTQDSDIRQEANDSEEEVDLNDLTFDPGHPLIEDEIKKKKKKQNKRQKMTKKEAEEAEAWAAGFNSMCEDVEEFPLLVE